MVIISQEHWFINLVQNDEEPEDVVKEKPAWEGTGVKRSRNAEVHNLCERVREIM